MNCPKCKQRTEESEFVVDITTSTAEVVFICTKCKHEERINVTSVFISECGEAYKVDPAPG